jgi:hypothetical protein
MSVITQSDLQAYFARHGNDDIEEQTAMDAPFYAKHLKKRFRKQAAIVVPIKSGGVSSMMWLLDGGNLPDRASISFNRTTTYAKVMLARVGFGRQALEELNGVDDAADLFDETLESVAAQFAKLRGKAAIQKDLGSPSSVTNATTIVVADPSGWTNGDSVDRENAAGTYQDTRTVDNVAYNTDGTFGATITLSAGNGATPLATDVFYPRGASANAPTALDTAAAAAALYGMAATQRDWSANRINSVGTLSLDEMRVLSVIHHRRRGRGHDISLTAPENAKRYSDLNIAQRRFTPGEALEGSEKVMPTFEGKKIVVDPNCSTTQWYLLTMADFYWHQTVKLHASKDGPKGGVSPGMVQTLIPTDSFVVELQAWETGELIVRRRSGISLLDGITG